MTKRGGRRGIAGPFAFLTVLLGATAAHAALAPQSTQLPGLSGTSRRQEIDPRAAPWTAIARLNVPGVSRCTAVMIAPTLALTAAHCLVSLRLGHVAPPSAVHIVTGYESGRFTRHSIATAVSIAPGYDPARESDTKGADVALITLAEPVIDPAAALPLGQATPGAPAALGGYSQDRAEVITADLHCQAEGTAYDGERRPVLVHNCAGTRGTSGAALLDGFGGGWRVVGIAVAGFDGHQGGVAVPAAAIAADFGLPLR